MSINRKLRDWFFASDSKRREFAVSALNFSEEHKNALVIIADADTDVILMAHKGLHIPMRFTGKDGKRQHIVASALNYRRMEREGSRDIDQFLLAVDSGLFNLAKALYDKRKAGVKGKILSWTFGHKDESGEEVASGDLASEKGILSPVQLIESE